MPTTTEGGRACRGLTCPQLSVRDLVRYTTQDADPLLGALTSRAISSAIEGALGGDIFGSIHKAFSESALHFSRLGISGNDEWSQVQYLQRVINFSTIIERDGLAKAIEDSAAQILHEDAISSILKSVNTVGEFIQKAIDENKFKRVQKGSSFFKELEIDSKNKLTFKDDLSDLTGILSGDELLEGSFGSVDTEFGAITSRYHSTIGDDFNLDIQFENGKQTYVELKNSTGNTVLVIEPTAGNHYLVYDSYGDYLDAKIKSVQNNYEFSLKDGYIEQYKIGNLEAKLDTNHKMTVYLTGNEKTNQFINLLENNPLATTEEIWQLMLSHERPTGLFDTSNLLTRESLEEKLINIGFSEAQLIKYSDSYRLIENLLGFSPSDTVIDYVAPPIQIEAEYYKLTINQKKGDVLFPGEDLNLGLIDPLESKISASLETSPFTESVSAGLASNLGLKTNFYGGQEFSGGLEVSVDLEVGSILEKFSARTNISASDILSMPEATVGIYTHYENPEISTSVTTSVNSKGILEISFKTINFVSKIAVDTIEFELKREEERDRQAMVLGTDQKGNLLIIKDLLSGRIAQLNQVERVNLEDYFKAVIQSQINAPVQTDLSFIARGLVNSIEQTNEERYQNVFNELPIYQNMYQGLSLPNSLTPQQRALYESLTISSLFNSGNSQ